MNTEKRLFFILTTIMTVLRVFLAPLLIYSIFAGMHPVWWWLLYLCIETSDLLDGYLSRKWKVTSDIGKTIDPLADVLSRNVIIVYFMWQGVLFWLPGLVILVRELAMSIFRVVRFKRKAAVAANVLGKLKTVGYSLSIGTALLSQHLLYAISPGDGASSAGVADLFQTVANLFLIISTFLSVLSFVVYMVQALRAP